MPAGGGVLGWRGNRASESGAEPARTHFLPGARLRSGFCCEWAQPQRASRSLPSAFLKLQPSEWHASGLATASGRGPRGPRGVAGSIYIRRAHRDRWVLFCFYWANGIGTATVEISVRWKETGPPTPLKGCGTYQLALLSNSIASLLVRQSQGRAASPAMRREQVTDRGTGH